MDLRVEKLWNNEHEVPNKDIKQMVSYDDWVSCIYWKTKFTVHTDTYDKQLGDVISKDNKPMY